MAKIIPFNGVFYNQKKIKDMSKVVSPPYDVISESARKELEEKSPFNMVHLILSQAEGNLNKYQKAGKDFSNWQKKGVLVQDDQPCIYVYRLKFEERKGKVKERIGFISLLRLEDGNSKVFPHEHTHTAPKIDRLNLVREVKANLSPIFVIYKDKKHVIQNLFDKVLKKTKPFISFKNDGQEHQVYRVSEAGYIKQIQLAINNSQLCIADGHHRFEVANMYRAERKFASDFDKNALYNYCMAYFLDTDSKGLVIWPCHRAIKNMNLSSTNELFDKLKDNFTVKKVKNKVALQKALNSEPLSIGLYNGSFFILCLKNEDILDKILPDASLAYKRLTVSILNNLVLKSILHLELLDTEHIYFTPDFDEAVKTVDKKESNFCFLLNPVKIEELLAVAFAGEKMPPKSTFFFPKATTGILVNKF
jgi:uncharacterized protein (DUF1015 family)